MKSVAASSSRPDRPDLVAAAIRDAHDGRLDLEAMGAADASTSSADADRSVRSRATERSFAGLLAPRS